MSDAETMTLLREIAASEAGLPSQLASRIGGETIGELRKDAKQLALDLGYAEPAEAQPRDKRGRFQSTSGQALSGQAFNDAVRRWAGYATSTEPPEQPTADLGIGRGGSALPRQAPAPDMNAIIRGTLGARRGAEWQFAEQIAGQGP